MTRPQKVKRVHPDTGEFVIFDSLVDAEKETLKSSKPNISKCLSGQIKKHAGYIWEKVIEDTDETSTQEWKAHPTLQNIEVSNYGLVKENGVLRKQIHEKRGGNMKIYVHNNAYLLWKIVAETWLPGFNVNLFCQFKNGDRTDCSPGNLAQTEFLIKAPRVKPVPKSKINPIECNKCSKSFSEELFQWRTDTQTYRPTCKDCLKSDEKDIVDKLCTTCNEIFPSNKFHGNSCNKCTWKHKVTSNQAKTELPEPPEKCIRCHSPGLFQWRQELNAYRNVCTNCTRLNNKQKKYWKEYRLKKKTINLKSFLEHNAKVHREWIMNNPEAAKKINLSKPKSVIQKLTQLFYNADKKNIPYDKTQSDLLMIKMSTPCSFCGYLDLDIRVNTLTLINRDLGYTNANTLSACTTCAFMKHTRSIPQFLGSVFDIVAYRNLDTFGLPTARKLPDSKWSSNGHVSIHNYEKKLGSNKNIKNLVDFPCYLCGISPSDGIDRTDSSKGYTVDNINSCCSSCNYLKKDTDLQEFLNHLPYIFNTCSESSFEIEENASSSYSKEWMQPKDDTFELCEFFTNAVVLGHDDTNDNSKTQFKRVRNKWIENPLHYRILVYSLNSSGEIDDNPVASYPSMKECADTMCYNYIGLTLIIKEHNGVVCNKQYKLVTEKSIERWQELSKSVTEHSQKIFERDARKYGKQKFKL